MTDRPPVRWTTTALTIGTLLSAACFVAGFLLTLVGGDAATEDPRRLELVLRSAAELHPWGWSMLGVLLLLATPAAGLVTSFFEMRRAQPRAAFLALLVLGILAAAALVAVSGA